MICETAHLRLLLTAQQLLEMSGAPCRSCRRWVPESGSSIFCTLCGGSFQLARLAQDPKFTARDFLDLSSRITHLIGEFFEWVRRFRRYPLILLHLRRLLVNTLHRRAEGLLLHQHKDTHQPLAPIGPLLQNERLHLPLLRPTGGGSPDLGKGGIISFDPQSTGKGSSTTSSTFKVASCRAPSCRIPASTTCLSS